MTTNAPDPGTGTPRQATEAAAVLLVAHGSARSDASAEPVLALSRALAARGFTEVRTGFWKEEPFLHQALDTMRARRVLVLPVFLADGYFSRLVVPRELKRAVSWAADPARVRLLPPLGVDPGLDRLVIERAHAALPEGVSARDAALVVLGHGTPRDPESAKTVLATCTRLADQGEFARVMPAFIDQDPRVEWVIGQTGERTSIVVPFLVGAGFHGGMTVPASLADAGDAIVYAEPVGTHPDLVEVVARILREARAMDEAPAGAPTNQDPTPDRPLSGTETALALRVARGGQMTFLQVEIRVLGDDAYELRHVHDAHAADTELDERTDTDALVTLARRDDALRHRPLRTAANLPAGWRHRARGARAVIEALVALYGPAVAHWFLGERDALEVEGWARAVDLQTGRYAALAGAEPAAIAEGIRRCCDGLPCLRTRAWDPAPPGAEPTRESADDPVGEDPTVRVPCPAPCPILLGTVLEIVGEESPDG